jgi:hypothetical protein
MPPPAAGPTREDVEATAGQAEQAQVDAIMAAAPQPSAPYQVGTINDVIDGILTLAKKSGVDLPIEWEPPSGAKEWPNPLPPEVWLPLVALADVAQQDPAFSKHAFEPSAITDDASLRKAGLQVDRMATDTKFVDALRPPQPGAPPPSANPEMPPTPQE